MEEGRDGEEGGNEHGTGQGRVGEASTGAEPGAVSSSKRAGGRTRADKNGKDVDKPKNRAQK
jgi:hypothetical protein